MKRKKNCPNTIISKRQVMHLCIYGVPVGETLNAYLSEMESILLEDAASQKSDISVLDCKQHLTVRKRLDKIKKEWVADVYSSRRGILAAQRALAKYRRVMMNQHQQNDASSENVLVNTDTFTNTMIPPQIKMQQPPVKSLLEYSDNHELLTEPIVKMEQSSAE